VSATLNKRLKIAEGTYELTFDLDAEKIKFSAGQYCRLKLPKLDDTNENRSRKFSILNSPDDNRRRIIGFTPGGLPSSYQLT
jgi:NAD(P)H-flavin reductase